MASKYVTIIMCFYKEKFLIVIMVGIFLFYRWLRTILGHCEFRQLFDGTKFCWLFVLKKSVQPLNKGYSRRDDFKFNLQLCHWVCKLSFHIKGQRVAFFPKKYIFSLMIECHFFAIFRKIGCKLQVKCAY